MVQLDRSAGEGRILHATLEALRAQDADTGHVGWMRGAAPTGMSMGYRL